MQNRFKLIATDGGFPVTIPLSIWGSPMLLPNCLNRYSDKDETLSAKLVSLMHV